MYYFEQSQLPGTVASYLHVNVDPAELPILKDQNSIDLSTVITNATIRSPCRAVVTFVVGGTIRRWQQQQGNEAPKRYSFIVHTETGTVSHNWQHRIVTALIEQLRLAAQGNIATITPIITDAYNDLQDSITIAGTLMPSLPVVLGLIPTALNGTQP